MAENEISRIGEKVVLYTLPSGRVTASVYFEDDNFWLTQKAMGELFGVDFRTVSEHLKNVYESGELDEQSTLRRFRSVQKEGDREVERTQNFYNLDAIIYDRADSEKPTMGLTTWKNSPAGKILKGDIKRVATMINVFGKKTAGAEVVI